MKILFEVSVPFWLAHGGSQVVTESLMRELPGLGVEVEPARWWDSSQRGDLIHYVERPLALNVRLAHEKGYKVVVTEWLDQTASRAAWKLQGQKLLITAARRLLGNMTARLGWSVYREADAFVFALENERRVASHLFGLPPERGHVIGHGLEVEALRALAEPAPQEDYLLCVATIAPRKNSLLLARAARLANVPVLFLGKPYAEDSPYYKEFLGLVDGRNVRHGGFVPEAEKHARMRSARGYVHLSQFESGCIAVYEAAAAGLPLLLSDLPWARHGYPANTGTRHIAPTSVEEVARGLKEFHAQARRSPKPTFPVESWRGIASRYLTIYQGLLAGKAR
jgi:glycosyltransferase involved in cell wall biosynthesis